MYVYVYVCIFFSEPDGKEFQWIADDMGQHCYGGDWPYRALINVSEDIMGVRNNNNDQDDIPRLLYEVLEDNHVIKQNGITMMDGDIRDHLGHLPLDKSILVLFGDHGIGYGPYPQSLRGKSEHENPPLFISVPKRILNQNPGWRDMLRVNSERLITVFDLHATLRGMARSFMSDFALETIPEEISLGWNFPGLNLAKDEVPLERKCATSGIPPHYCNCASEATWVGMSLERIPHEFVTAIKQTTIRTMTELGFSSNASVFKEHCYVDATMFGKEEADPSNGMITMAQFELAQLSLLLDPFHPKGKFRDGERFRAQISASVIVSPENETPLFQMIGEIAMEDDCTNPRVGQILHFKRLSIHANEPCRSAVDEIEFCLCREGTQFG